MRVTFSGKWFREAKILHISKESCILNHGNKYYPLTKEDKIHFKVEALFQVQYATTSNRMI